MWHLLGVRSHETTCYGSTVILDPLAMPSSDRPYQISRFS